MFCEEVVESFEVAGFLVVHVFHQGSEMGVCFYYWWGLGRVDECCCEFAGVVDAEGGVEEFLLTSGQLSLFYCWR